MTTLMKDKIIWFTRVIMQMQSFEVEILLLKGLRYCNIILLIIVNEKIWLLLQIINC